MTKVFVIFILLRGLVRSVLFLAYFGTVQSFGVTTSTKFHQRVDLCPLSMTNPDNNESTEYEYNLVDDPPYLVSQRQQNQTLQEQAKQQQQQKQDKYRPLFDAIETISTRPYLDDAQRIFHGRGGIYDDCEHLTLDWFPPVLVLTSFTQELSHDELTKIGTMLESCWKQRRQQNKTRNGENNNNNDDSLNWVYQHRSKTNSTTKLMTGQIPNPHIVSENGLKFVVNILNSQNHGIFLDMSNGRNWLQNNSKDKKVLNLFAYTCSFSIAALQGGAEEVVNIDMARGPLKIGQRNHELNDYKTRSSSSSSPNNNNNSKVDGDSVGGNNGSNHVPGVARFLAHNIFKTWGKLRQLGPYDIIVCDPPSYQKGSFIAKKDYIKIIRRLPLLLVSSSPDKENSSNERSSGDNTDEDDSFVLLCLNAPELDSAWLKETVKNAAPELKFVERLPNPETFPALDEERALKVLVYRLSP